MKTIKSKPQMVLLIWRKKVVKISNNQRNVPNGLKDLCLNEYCKKTRYLNLLKTWNIKWLHRVLIHLHKEDKHVVHIQMKYETRWTWFCLMHFPPLLLISHSPFYSFRRDLRCLRNTIHINLFVTYILSASVWFILLAYQVITRIVLIMASNWLTLGQRSSSRQSDFTSFIVFTGERKNGWSWLHRPRYTLQLLLGHELLLDARRRWVPQLERQTAINPSSWAGLYLYMLVVETFSGDNMRFKTYAGIGWGE